MSYEKSALFTSEKLLRHMGLCGEKTELFSPDVEKITSLTWLWVYDGATKTDFRMALWET